MRKITLLIALLLFFIAGNAAHAEFVETGQELEVKDYATKTYIYEALRSWVIHDVSDYYFKKYKANSVGVEGPIQIIDINKGKVIKNVQKNTDLQQEVEKFLKGITGVYVKLNPYPHNGFVVKIPLEPNVMVKNQWFNDLVDELIIIFPIHEHPYFMIFDNENHPYFLTFQADTSKFLRLLNFKP